MNTTAGGWSIGDYVGTVSDDRQSLSTDLFAFADIGQSSDGGASSLTLDEDQSTSEDEPSVAIAHAVVYGSSFRPTGSNYLSLSETSTSGRAAVWDDLKWTPLWELHTKYIAMSGDSSLTIEHE